MQLKQWNLNCREATALLLQAQDRRLRWSERLALRLHLLICPPCPRFARQLQLMRGAMQPWRAYRDHTGGDDASGANPQDSHRR
jgi:hypothetical protein